MAEDRQNGQDGQTGQDGQVEIGDPGDPHVTVCRVLEYTGPVSWITQVFQHNRIPLQGVKEFGAGGGKGSKSVKSGIVSWVPAEAVVPRMMPLRPGGVPSRNRAEAETGEVDEVGETGERGER